jgi:hypothetical protein
MIQMISSNTATSTMNDSTSSETRLVVLPLLIPRVDTSTVKQLWLQEKTIKCPFNEYRLNGIPESLKAFVDPFWLADTFSYEINPLIWTSENCFVRVSRVGNNYGRHELPGVYRKPRFDLILSGGSHASVQLRIHSSTLDEAMSCLDLLVGIHDDCHFEKMTFYEKYIPGGDNEPQLCPLTSVLLEKILNAKRKNAFHVMVFTPDQCRTLATCGTRTDIRLYRCKFQDDGEAFLEALAAREDPETGLAKFSIRQTLPFAEGNLVLFMGQPKIETLTLTGLNLENEEACRALAEAELQYLKLPCWLADGGAALVESVRVGRGPKGLILDKFEWEDEVGHDWIHWRPFDSSERFVSLLNALRGNTYLERLDLSEFDFREEGFLDALAAGLFENKGLVTLDLETCSLGVSGVCKVLSAISTHPSLRTIVLDLKYISTMDGTKATQEVAKMLLYNTQLEDIRFVEDDTFDSLAWVKLVTPRLEYNIYRKRFAAIQNIRSPSTRAAVMARALSHANDKPSPAFMLLRQNVDILASYSCVESQIATPSRKRSRSPSSDEMIVSNVGSP